VKRSEREKFEVYFLDDQETKSPQRQEKIGVSLKYRGKSFGAEKHRG